MKMRFLGDCHQHIPEYLQAIKDIDYSVQLGDLGMNYKFLDYYKVDSEKHKFFKANHDNYGAEGDFIAHDLDHYGTHPDFPHIFFVRGAWSIDQKYRTAGYDWWPEEQLSPAQLQYATEEYALVKPEVMLSHECPFSVMDQLGLDPNFALNMGHKTHLIESRTNLALEEMFRIHQPKLWIFGHYHKDFDKVINGTRFVCLTLDPNLKRCKQRFLDIEV